MELVSKVNGEELDEVFCVETRTAFRALLLKRQESEEFHLVFSEFSEFMLSRATCLKDGL